MNLKISIVIISLLLLQACASGLKYTPMTQATRDAIKEVQIYDLVIQDEVKPSVELSQASLMLGGGLIGAMIDSSVNKGRSLTAQDIMAPLYDATENTDYRKISAEKFFQSIGKEFSISEKEVLAQSILLSNDELNEKVSNLKEGKALIYLSNFYSLVNNSKTLTTDTFAFVYMNPKFPITVEEKAVKPSKSDKKNEPLLVYYNVFSYQSESIGEGDLHSINQWSENGGELFKNKLLASVERTASMLMYDLNPTKNENCLTEISAKIPTALGSSNIKGAQLRVDDKRKFVRTVTGGLISFTSDVRKVANKKSDKSCTTQGEENV